MKQQDCIICGEHWIDNEHLRLIEIGRKCTLDSTSLRPSKTVEVTFPFDVFSCWDSRSMSSSMWPHTIPSLVMHFVLTTVYHLCPWSTIFSSSQKKTTRSNSVSSQSWKAGFRFIGHSVHISNDDYIDNYNVNDINIHTDQRHRPKTHMSMLMVSDYA